MFLTNFYYTLKSICRNKALVFWTLAFPILLATLFHAALSNIMNNVTFKPIKVAVVDDDNYQNNQVLRTSIAMISGGGDGDQIFQTNYTDINEAKKALDNGSVDGYITVSADRKPQLFIKNNGTNQTIIQMVLDEVIQNEAAINDLVKNEVSRLTAQNQPVDYNRIYTRSAQSVMKESLTKLRDQSNKKSDIMVIEYYSLIAMLCLQGGLMGVWLTSRLLANMSTHGRRVSVSSAKRSILALSGLSAVWLIILAMMAILYAYTIICLGVDYGANTGMIILLSVLGSLAGMMLGATIGSLVQTNEQTKYSIMTGVTLTGCFLAGMMGVSMKYVVDSTAPIVNLINPAAMITDGFYALYVGNADRYWFDCLSLLIISGVMVALVVMTMRKERYDSF